MDEDIGLVLDDVGSDEIIFDESSEEGAFTALDDSSGEFPDESIAEEEETEESKEETKKSRKKSKKKKLSPDTTKLILLCVCIVVILVFCGWLGIKLIQSGLVLGMFVIAAGFAGAILLLVANLNRLKMYERMRDMTKKSYEKESVKLDEDMEKCQGRIAALDARAEERGKAGPPQE